MSQALFKRSLEIVEVDLEVVKPSTLSKAKKSIHKSKQQKDSIMNLIPENQRLTCYTRDTKSKTKRE